MVETVPDSVLAVQNATNATRDMEPESQEGKLKEIVKDNVDLEPKVLIVVDMLPHFSLGSTLWLWCNMSSWT